MSTLLRKTHRTNRKPKGSFPSLNDEELILVKYGSSRKQVKEQMTKFVCSKLKNLKTRLTKSKVGVNGLMNKSSNNNNKNNDTTIRPSSFEQSLSGESGGYREDEISLMEYMDEDMNNTGYF